LKDNIKVGLIYIVCGLDSSVWGPVTTYCVHENEHLGPLSAG